MGHKFLSEKQMRRAEHDAMQKFLAWLGPNHAQRIKAIDALFEQRTATIWSTCYVDLSRFREVTARERTSDPHVSIASLIIRASGKSTAVKVDGYVFFTVSRSLSSMDFRERTYLRLAELPQ